MTASTHILRIEPQQPLVASALPAWEVWVGSERMSANAFPFYALDHTIALDAGDEIPTWRQTRRRVSVRRAGSYVLWLPLLRSSGEDFTTISAPLAFHGTQYTTAIARAITAMRDANMVLPDHSRNGGWFSMTAAELREVLERGYPAPAAEPDHNHLLHAVGQAIASVTDFEVCEAPETHTTTRRALVNGGEICWHFARTASGTAVQFEANPAFPLWLRSPAFDAAFAERMLS